jgi:integrase
MASASIVRRVTATGKVRFVVQYRTGGRESRMRHGGSFPTRRAAEVRQQMIILELAAGRVPELVLERAPVAVETFRVLADRYLETRIDATENTLKTYRQAFKHLGRLEHVDPHAVTLADVQEWVSGLALAPASIRKYLDAVRQVLDFAGVEPNPARSLRLRLPRADVEEVCPPTFAHVRALLETITPRYQRHVRLLDWTGLRVGELQALTWGDLDFPGHRLRVARGRTKGRTAGRRWIPLPSDLLADLASLVPLEDRDLDSPVFPGLSDDGLRNAMTRACKLAGVPAFGPHDLRHRYISLLVLSGVPATVVKGFVGHARASMTLDVYSHVLLDEPQWSLDARRRLVERRPGDVPVTSRDVGASVESADSRGFRGVEDTGIEPVTFALPARRSPS